MSLSFENGSEDLKSLDNPGGPKNDPGPEHTNERELPRRFQQEPSLEAMKERKEAIVSKDEESTEKREPSVVQSKGAQKKKRKSGVVYISRIPPGMDIGALRSLLSRAGKLGRVWLRPESAASLAERRSLTSSRRRTEFRDGWVEFLRRRDACRAVDLLNGNPMSGATRRGRWGDDLWCLRFLPGFTWSDLVEETCSGAREKTLRVKAEVAAARRERAFVEERVAMANRIERDADAEKKPVRRFRQKRAIGQRDWEEDVDERRAREATERLEEEMETGRGRKLDEDLVSMLFKRRKKSAESADGKQYAQKLG